MASELGLLIYVIGQPDSTVRVHIDSSKLIIDLKAAIFAKLRDPPPNISATHLDLYKVRLPRGPNIDRRARDKVEELKHQAMKRAANGLDEDVTLNERGPLKALNDLLPDFGPEYWEGMQSEPVHVLVEIIERSHHWHTRRAIPYALDPKHTPRDALVKYLYEALETHNFIQIRGIPASGKSVILRFLHTYVFQKRPEMNIFRIDSWPKYDPAELKSPQDYAGRLKVITRAEFPSHTPTYLFFDEGQDTYVDSGLWNGFFKTLPSNYRVAVFCSFGSPSDRVDVSLGTPDRLPDAKRLQLLPTKDFPFGLFLTRDEFNDMIARSDLVYPIDKDVCDRIFDWTRGHAGSIEWFLTSIKDKNGTLRNAAKATYTLELFHSQFSDQATAKVYIRESCARGLPLERELARPEIAALFRKVLEDPGGLMQIEGEEDSDEWRLLNECHKKGWLYAVNTPGRFPTFSFPTPLHRSYISWLLADPVGEIQFDNIFKLCESVVLSLNPSQIFNVPRRDGLPAVGSRPPEAQYQDAFYRALHATTSGAVCISPEYASASSARKAGRIDFFIKSKKWGIEITREGSRLQEHSDHFGTRGAYGEWTQNGSMEDYVLLDCRTNPVRESHQKIPGLYQAHFEQNSSGSFVTIYDQHLRIVTQQTALLENKL